MTDRTDLTAAAYTLESAVDPAVALAAVELACTAAGLLLGQTYDVPLLGCSAAVVSLDAACTELRPFHDQNTDQPAPPLGRETTDDVPPVLVAVLELITASAAALRRITARTGDPAAARACSRALLHLKTAARHLRDDLP